MNLIEQMQKITIDLGNSNYKMLADDKKIIDSSNVEEVEFGTFGAYQVNNKSYIFGEGAAMKYNTNKICLEKRALLGRALYPVVEDNQEVAITTLLPLSLYITNINKDKYKELLQGQYTVINPNGHTKNFTVSEVSVCC